MNEKWSERKYWTKVVKRNEKWRERNIYNESEVNVSLQGKGYSLLVLYVHENGAECFITIEAIFVASEAILTLYKAFRHVEFLYQT